MLRKLYTDSGLILLAVLCAGVWFGNTLSLFPAKNVSAAAAVSLSHSLGFREDF